MGQAKRNNRRRLNRLASVSANKPSRRPGIALVTGGRRVKPALHISQKEHLSRIFSIRPVPMGMGKAPARLPYWRSAISASRRQSTPLAPLETAVGMRMSLKTVTSRYPGRGGHRFDQWRLMGTRPGSSVKGMASSRKRPRRWASRNAARPMVMAPWPLRGWAW